MTEAERLIAAVKADPTDAPLRLVLADALDDEGAYRAAAWLRLDVQLAEYIERTGFTNPPLLRERDAQVSHLLRERNAQVDQFLTVESLYSARFRRRSASKRFSSRRSPRR